MLFLTAIGVLMMASASYQQNTYTIQSGDTYCKIALQYGCPNWQTLANANPTQTERGLQVGAVLTIPSTCGSRNCISPSYGDSYQTIAQRYNIDVNCLTDYNCGQPLSSTVCLPSNCQAYGSSTASYKIVSGDTYCAIAQRLGCPNWQTLANANPSQPVNGLQVGATLTIPSTCTGKSNCITPSYGDSYQTIAQRYNIDVNCLTDYNCGQPLSSTVCLPSNCQAYGSSSGGYKIVSGDTYCAIAQRFGCPSWQTLANANPTQAERGLQVGATLTIPSTCTGKSNCITPSYGDNYSTIAQRYNIDVNCLMDYNCNATFSNSICLPSNCPAYSAPTNPAPLNGWVGNTFYCNGVATNNLSQTCGGIMYYNGNAVTGIVGSTFFCNGVSISSPPPQQYTCNGVFYYGGLTANGYPYSGSQFYCNGYPVNGNTVATTNMMCGGKLYSNGKLFTGFDNGSFYCDGVENLTGSGVCGGYYWNNYKQVHTCTKTKSQANQTCQDYINNYNNAATLQNILDCNPQFTATNCPLATGSIFYF